MGTATDNETGDKPGDDSGDEHGSYLTATDDQPRLRRPSDVVTVVVGLAFVVWGLIEFGSSHPLEAALKQFAAALPEWAVALLGFGYSIGFIYAVVVVVTFIVKRRWSALRDVALAALIAGLVTTYLVSAYGDGLWPPFFTEFVEGKLRAQFPIIRVAIVTAILVASAPYWIRPIRRLGWTIVVIVGIAAVALALSAPSGVVVSVGVGLISAAAIRLIFGSPMGYPDVESVRAALTRMRISTKQLQVDPDQLWGARRFIGTTSTGTDIAVKTYGRDATDSQVMAKIWHAVMYRGSHQVTMTRVQSVQQEALVTIMAGRAEVSVPDVKTATAPTPEVALLVTTRSGTLLADVDAAKLDQTALTGLWKQVAAMHEAGVTHGSLGVDSVRASKTGFEIVDFEKGSTIYRDSDACLDVVTLLFDTAVKVGPNAAVAAAAAGLGNDRLAASLGYLEPPALSSREQHSTKHSSKLLKQIQKQVATTTGTKIPKPMQLRRFGWRNLLTIVVVLLFVSALIPLLTGVDYASVWNSIKNANWWLVALAMVVGQVVFLPQATALRAAMARPIPLVPMTILQPAVAFISFAVPGVAGRTAMEATFLHKYGVAPTASAVKAGVEGFAGFLVQVAILILALLTGSLILTPQATDSTDSTNSQDSSSGAWLIFGIVVVAVIAVVVVVMKNKKLHDLIVPQVQQAWQALKEVLGSPRIALSLLGSQLAVQLVWGLVMWLTLLSLGVHLSLISCTAVVVGTTLLGGMLPVPGGVGVSAAIISALLVPLGVSAAVAVGAATIWRLSTFYLPAVEGIFANKYLSKNGYL